VATGNSRQADAAAVIGQLLGAERSCVRVKGELFRTWIDYQIERPELHGDLGLTSP
jgi:hypothetical protein